MFISYLFAHFTAIAGLLVIYFADGTAGGGGYFADNADAICWVVATLMLFSIGDFVHRATSGSRPDLFVRGRLNETLVGLSVIVAIMTSISFGFSIRNDAVHDFFVTQPLAEIAMFLTILATYLLSVAYVGRIWLIEGLLRKGELR
ncbi:hypothetical protein [Hoeflea olei]|uniref:Uncharacterized protein n=1 Tax=Hoeflea olei TaxID=1480615 RepID=A0A1C1YSX3_9HYPH|nr:hypothetical protein [Hoeflea olei]OCW56546.1 hypothetical protein AWJ14_16500 [Hoeflea olei]